MALCAKCGIRWPDALRACPDDGTPLGGPDAATRPDRPLDPPGTATDLMSRYALEPGTMVGDYSIVARIGKGGMGTVFSAVHPLIGKKAAIKVLDLDLCEDPLAVERFVQEARAANQIRHPNIVDVFNFGELPDGRRFLVMELLEGENLARRLKRLDVDLREILAVVDQIADALEAAHEQGIVHRDLKPENVFLVPARGQRMLVKLLDFGIAKLAGGGQASRSHHTATGVLLGTPAYMSPEQVRGKAVDHRTDLYALGVMLFEMTAGVRPFVAASTLDLMRKHVQEAPRPPSAVRRDPPPALDALVLGLLAKDPTRRPTLSEVREVLTGVRASLGTSLSGAEAAVSQPVPVVGVPDPPAPAPPPAASLGRIVVVGGLIGMVAAATVVGWLVFARSGGTPPVPSPRVESTSAPPLAAVPPVPPAAPVATPEAPPDAAAAPPAPPARERRRARGKGPVAADPATPRLPDCVDCTVNPF